MGYVNHHALIISSWNKEILEKIHAKSLELMPDITTEVKPYVVNGGGSFAVLPDGSKEGWSESDEYDDKRNDLIDFFDQFNYEDGSNPVRWCLASFDEEGRVAIEGK